MLMGRMMPDPLKEAKQLSPTFMDNPVPSSATSPNKVKIATEHSPEPISKNLNTSASK